MVPNLVTIEFFSVAPLYDDRHFAFTIEEGGGVCNIFFGKSPPAPAPPFLGIEFFWLPSDTL